MKNTILLFCLITMLGCYNNGDSNQQYSDSVATEMDYEDGFEQPQAPPQTEPAQPSDPPEPALKKDKKIIKDGHINIEIDDLRKAKHQMDTTLQKFGAYYENEVFESSSYESLYRLKIRVPAKNFDALVAAANDNGGKVTMKNINARDVTEEFYDITTRLENNESYLEQYRKLLNRAGSIQDILEVQEKIRVLEEEMDSKKGRLKYLSDQVSFSTLNLMLIQRHEWKGAEKKPFGQRLLTSLKSGGEIFTEFILVVLRLWPFAILVGVVIFVIKRWRRKKQRKDQS